MDDSHLKSDYNKKWNYFTGGFSQREVGEGGAEKEVSQVGNVEKG